MEYRVRRERCRPALCRKGSYTFRRAGGRQTDWAENASVPKVKAQKPARPMPNLAKVKARARTLALSLILPGCCFDIWPLPATSPPTSTIRTALVLVPFARALTISRLHLLRTETQQRGESEAVQYSQESQQIRYLQPDGRHLATVPLPPPSSVISFAGTAHYECQDEDLQAGSECCYAVLPGDSRSDQLPIFSMTEIDRSWAMEV